MTRRLLVFTAFLFAAGHAFAQTPPKPPAAPAPPAPAAVATPAAPPAPPAAPPAPAGPRQPINIKVDVTIAEEGGGATPLKKTVSTVAGDGFSGSVRETATLNTPNPGGGFGPGFGPTALNVDATPVILPNGKIRVGFNFQYSAGQNALAGDGRARTDIRQSLTLVLESGKALKVSEATDPLSDRHVTVEVMATILK
jgi:hypothetical protein